MASFSMRFFVWVAFLAAIITLVPATPAPIPAGGHRGSKVKGIGVQVSNVNATNVIANRYIVVYNNNATDASVQSHQSAVMTALKKRSIHARSIDGRSLSSEMSTFSMSGWRGMSLDAEDSMIMEIASNNDVAYVEADTWVKATALKTQTNATTGLSRLSSTKTGATTYTFDTTAGSGVVVYVVDTGIRIDHTEFEGRATWGDNFVNTNDTDENGHGSHVAGTVAGATFGVAKSASLVAVKVLDADGAGSNSGVISGVNFVSTNATARNLSGKAVLNMSVGGSKSNALNSAIAAVTKAGVTVVVAAGNENQDAGNTSPASAASAITVGAIDASTDTKASFSNFGTSVDVFAPGVKVQSVSIASKSASEVLSGTSMASPHVAGLAAYLISLENLTTVDAVTARIKSLATSTNATVKGANAATTKLIANNGNGL